MISHLPRLCIAPTRLIASLALLAVPSFAHVGLTTPSGGEILAAGTTARVEWEVLVGHTTLDWDLDYSTTGPAGPWMPIATDLPPGDISIGAMHSYDWTVPDDPSNDVYVRITQDNVGQGDYEDINATPIEIVGLPEAVVYGCGTNPAGSMVVLAGSPALGGSITLGIDNPLGSQTPGALPFLFIADAPDPAYPCGTMLAGYGMGTSGVGELLVSLAAPNPVAPIQFGTPWTGAGTPGEVIVAVPNDPILLGLTFYAQGGLFDASAAPGARVGLADAVEFYLGA